MKKLAILVGAAKNDDKISEVVKNDLDRFNIYLQSICGGAWGCGEIIKIHNKSKLHIQSYLDIVKKDGYDFVFVYWTGHGGYDYYGNLMLELVDGEIKENIFWGLSSKQLVIMDTCRKVPSPPIALSMRATFDSTLNESSDGERILARIRYEGAIEQSNGLQRLYACSEDEYANASRKHSNFTDVILKTATSWHGQNVSKVLDVGKLCENAINQLKGAQTPDLCSPKDIYTYYPFAVNPSAR